MPEVEILYLAWNRLDYTSLTWYEMMRHTDWDLVTNVTVYDDGSQDGTLEFLREHLADCPVHTELRVSNLRSPPAIMNHFLATERAPLFVKLDNDIAVPSGWLNRLHEVMVAHPDIDLLGMEAGQTVVPEGKPSYGIQEASHIGGVGMMRTRVLQNLPEIPYRGRFGFTEHQDRHQLKGAWITPDLLVPQLDRIPDEPWKSLGVDYVSRGWQRDWPLYRSASSPYWDWIKETL